MTILSLFLLVARGAIVLALALIGVRILSRASASLRHAVLASAFVAVLALPMIVAIVPAWHTGMLTEAGTTGPAAMPVAEPAVSVPGAAPSVATVPPSQAPIPWATLFAGLWALGAAALLVRLGVGAARARRIAARGTPTAIVDDVRVVVSDEVAAPIVVGAFAPVIVVPRAASSWRPERWRVVLQHELAHVHRRDVLASFVAQVACALHWFDPLVWLAARRMREERELAADDAVLRDGARASTYAEHLVAIACAATFAAPAAALAMASPSRFEARLVALLDGGRSRRPAGRSRALAVAAAAGLVAVVAASVSVEAAPKRADDKIAPSDPALQAFVGDELGRVMTAQHASGAIAIVVDAKTGTVLAMATRGDGDARAARAPGSTLKPFTFAAAIDAGVVDSAVRCSDSARKYGDKTLSDAGPHGALDLGGILAVSSNVCTAKLAEPLGDRLGEALRHYHFAAPAHVDTHSFEGAAIAAGEALQISALELATAYTAFADAGVYHAPDGSSERVMTAETARTVMSLMERVVNGDDGTGHAARIAGVKVAGKTGTASSRAGRYYASFVGVVPADAPRFVVLVGVDGVTTPGGVAAAPAFASIASRALAR